MTNPLEAALIRLDKNSRTLPFYYNGLLGLLLTEDCPILDDPSIWTIPTDAHTQIAVRSEIEKAIRNDQVGPDVTRSILARLDQCFRKP